MKRYLFFLFILLSSLSFSFAPATTQVWVCVGGSAYAYHSNENCSGFRHCNHVMKTTTLDSAVRVYKRKPCKECYR